MVDTWTPPAAPVPFARARSWCGGHPETTHEGTWKMSSVRAVFPSPTPFARSFTYVPSSPLQLRIPRQEDMPKGFLQSLTGKPVAVKLKWGMEYRGAFLRARPAPPCLLPPYRHKPLPARPAALYLVAPNFPVFPLRRATSVGGLVHELSAGGGGGVGGWGARGAAGRPPYSLQQCVVRARNCGWWGNGVIKQAVAGKGF